MSKKYLFGLAIVLISVIVFVGSFYKTSNPLKHNIKQETFDLITKIRKEKKEEVITHFESIRERAHNIKTDKKMLEYFTLMRSEKGNPQIEFDIDKHYVYEYSNFYDILFIDSTGFIFHSIKKEADYQKNIFSSDIISNSKIVQTLRENKNKDFSDFEFYPPSNEAASFFIIDIEDKGSKIGWFVLQYDINSVNTILTDRKNLGRTGEVYLVNKKQMMLSKSRFLKDNTILQQKVETASVKKAFLSKSGEKISADYRGVNVFSSFDRFEIFGVTWVIIVEIDEDEVITEFYKKYKEFFVQLILDELSNQTIITLKSPSISDISKKNRVDMNEFAKLRDGEYLITEGVATCTAIAISYPDKFGYLAHISPTDEIYLDDFFTKYFLGNSYNNFLKDLIGQVKYYEIFPYEISKLQFVIVATHSQSFAKSIDTILSHKIELANIKFLYNPNARSVDVMMLQPNYDVHLFWNKNNTPAYNVAKNYNNLGDIVKKIIKYDI